MNILSSSATLEAKACETLPKSNFDFDNSDSFPPANADADFTFSYCGGSDFFLISTPLNGATHVKYGQQKPSYQDCASLEDEMTTTNSPEFPSQEYYCLKTNQGKYVWLRMDSFSNIEDTYFLTIDFEAFEESSKHGN